MPRYSHQYLIAVTVESDDPNPNNVSETELISALHARVKDIVNHDGIEAFGHNDTDEV